jgi:hypothetical protein
VKPPTRPRPIAPTVRVHLHCCRSQCHSSCHCCRFHCRCCCCRHRSPSHEGTRAQPVRVYEGAAQATRMQPKSAQAQLKPRGHSPSLQGCSSSHRAQPVRVCEGAAQATRVHPQTARAQPKPQGHSPSLRGHSPSHEGSAHLSLQGHSPSHSFPRIAKIQLNVVVIVDLLLPLLATLPGRTSCARGSIGRPHPCLDFFPPQRIAIATATATLFVLAVVTTSNFSPSQCIRC